MEEVTMEINGKQLTRESVKDWLKAKKITLWMDWIITDEAGMNKAVDWFMASVNDVAACTA